MPDEKGTTTTPAEKPTETAGEKSHLYFPVPYPTNGETANETISTLSVHPKLMAAAVAACAASKGTMEVSGKTFKHGVGKKSVTVPLNGTVLKDGAFPLWLREVIANASGYEYATPSDLALPLKGKGRAGTGVAAEKIKSKTLGVVRQVFASIRGAMPEDAARELARKIATENSSQLTDEEITALWAEAS